jgi:HD superfamily phosphohydrolase
MISLSYQDVLHGPIAFTERWAVEMLNDLLQCPEVYRLRHMRLLNFDVPYVQELATARRYAHSVGTCFAAYKIAASSHLDTISSKHLIAAALIHDIGILPYGHLIESELSRRDPSFSHEGLVRQILYGTYHRTNIYHQILPGRALQLFRVLERHGIDPEDVLRLICPTSGASSPISGGIDIDNIDNVHRMVALLGMDIARTNVSEMVSSARVTSAGQLVFRDAGIPAIQRWLDMRAHIYSIMIAHPACVAYNAFLQDLVRSAIDHGVISRDDWFLTDTEFEQRVLECPQTRSLAVQLRQGTQYRLIDYVWFRNSSGQPLPNQLSALRVEDHGMSPPIGGRYFYWPEQRKISRRIEFLGERSTGVQQLGQNSSSLLVAMIDPGFVPAGDLQRFRRGQQREWRRDVCEVVERLADGWEFHVSYPETFPIELGVQEANEEQLQFFPD